MTTQDPIDQDIIDAYRDDRAPAGFAARVTHNAVRRARPRSRELLWGLPAAALIVLVLVVWNFTNDDGGPSSPRIALSFSEMPSGLPTLSNVKTVAVPSIAALSAIPTLPTLDLTMPAIGKLKSSARRSAATDLPN